MSHPFPLVSVLAVALAAGTGRAQVAPGQTRPHAPSTFWDAANPQLKQFATDIESISFRKLAINPPGVWTVCLGTIMAQGSKYNPAGTIDLVILEVDLKTTPPTLTPKSYANQLNTPDIDYYLHLEPGQGRYAVFERLRGSTPYDSLGVFLAYRPNTQSNFGNAVRITNIKGATFGWHDPSIGYVDQRLKLFYCGQWIDRNSVREGVWMDDLIVDITNSQQPKARVAGNPTLVVIPNARSRPWTVHSTATIVGADGDVEGIWCAEFSSFSPGQNGPSYTYFDADLDPNTEHQLCFTHPTKSWCSSGGVLGGQLISAESGVLWNFAIARSADVAWMLGDVVKLGGQLDITFGAAGFPAQTVVFMSGGLMLTPFPLPGIFGAFALDLAGVTIIGAGGHSLDRTGSLSFPIPNLTPLLGRYQVQGLTISGNTMTLTNNAPVVIK